MQKLIKENFDSLSQFMNTIESRKNNKVMSCEHSSRTGSESFTGTRSYSEAKELLANGYTDILAEIKAGVAEGLKQTQLEQRRRVSTGVIGYAPHVPNAILGLPNSMIRSDSVPQKVKTISLIVGITENCGTDAKEFIKSGISALNVINRLELAGYRTSLKVAFYNATVNDEIAFGTVKVKDYREHLDLQKLCFPLAHPSMFRRFGFKWLETQPDIKESYWSCGYGRQTQSREFEKNNKKLHILDDNEYFIDLSVTRDCGYDPEKIIEKILKNS